MVLPIIKKLPAPTKDFERECILFFEEVVQIFGVPKSVGQIYGLLYASPVSLSFSDIVERLGISKGSASQGIQLLRSLGAINDGDGSGASDKALRVSTGLTTGIARNARVTYQPELSLRRLMSGILQNRIAPIAASGAERLAHLREFAEQSGAGNDFYLSRAKQLDKWRKRLKTVLPVLSVLLGPKDRYSQVK